MTDRERLIELISKSNCVDVWDYRADDFKEPNPIYELTDHLLANGVIVSPCKVGDTVYNYGDKQIKEWKITFVGKNSRNEYKFIAVVGKYEDLLIFWNFEIGKTVFLTKEEAERALKEREEM